MTVDYAALAHAHMSQQVTGAATIQAALSRLWDDTIDPADPIGSFMAFREKAVPYINAGQLKGQTTAETYFAGLKTVSGLSSSTPVLGRDITNGAYVKGSLTAASIRSLANADKLAKKGGDPVFSLAAAKSNMLGSAKRQVLNSSRRSLITLSTSDKDMLGWARVSDGRPCHFCAMLVSRGPVYDALSVHFKAHDRCGCSVRAVTINDPDKGWSAEAKAYRNMWDAHHSSPLAWDDFYGAATADGTMTAAIADARDALPSVRAAKRAADEVARLAAPAPHAVTDVTAPVVEQVAAVKTFGSQVDAKTRKTRISEGDWRYVDDRSQRTAVLLQNDYRAEQAVKKMATALREGADPLRVTVPKAWSKDFTGTVTDVAGTKYTDAQVKDALLDAARWLNEQTPAKPRVMYKGLEVPASKVKKLFQEGGTFDVNYSSFSTSEDVARRYAGRASGQQVIVRVKNTSGVPVNGNPTADFWKTTKEHLVTGNGRIVGVTEAHGGRTLYVDVDFG